MPTWTNTAPSARDSAGRKDGKSMGPIWIRIPVAAGIIAIAAIVHGTYQKTYKMKYLPEMEGDARL
jgi:hypothetical protein